MKELSRLRNNSIWKTVHKQHVYVQHGVGGAIFPSRMPASIKKSLKLVVCLITGLWYTDPDLSEPYKILNHTATVFGMMMADHQLHASV
jgi:hypothetical protein